MRSIVVVLAGRQSRRAGLQMGNVLSTENLQQYISEFAQKENQLRDAGQTFDAKDVKAYRQGLETSLINRGVDWNGNRAEGETDTHTPEERAVIEAYQKSVDPDMVDYINRVSKLQDQSYKAKQIYEISSVETKRADDLKAITGIDTNGYTNAINGTTITHIENRHGTNGAADHSMANVEDIARIGYVLQNYDDVRLLEDGDGNAIRSTEWVNSDKSHAVQVQYTKKIDGTYYVIEAVIDSKRKQNMVVSAYMNEKGSAAQSLNMEQSSPQLTPETPNGSNASINSIAQQPETVKGEEIEGLQRQLAAGNDLGLAEGLGRVGVEQVNPGQAGTGSQTENGRQVAGATENGRQVAGPTEQNGGLNDGRIQGRSEIGGSGEQAAERAAGLADGGQRDAGLGTDRQAGGLGESTGRSVTRSTRAQELAQLKNYVQALGAEKQSAREIGIRDGTKNAANLLLADEGLTDSMRQIRSEAESAGLRVDFVLGKMETRNRSGGVTKSSGVFQFDRDGTPHVYLQADSRAYSPQQLFEHELFHSVVAANKGLWSDIVDHLYQTHTQEEIVRMVDA